VVKALVKILARITYAYMQRLADILRWLIGTVLGATNARPSSDRSAALRQYFQRH